MYIGKLVLEKKQDNYEAQNFIYLNDDTKSYFQNINNSIILINYFQVLINTH